MKRPLSFAIICFFILIMFSSTLETRSSLMPVGVSGGQESSLARNLVGDSMVTDPSNMVLNLSQVGVGYMFNITVFVNISVSSYDWQVELSFNPAYFNVTQAGYTAGATSQFFAGQTTIPVAPTIDNIGGTILMGESLLGATEFRGPGAGSLFWTEFVVTVAPPTTNLTISIVPDNSFVEDTNLNEIPIPNVLGTNIEVVSSTTPPPTTNTMFITPAALNFYTNTTSVGTMFNVTVWVTTTVDTYDWQVKMFFNPSQITASQAGYTDGATSAFFKGHTTVPITPIIDNSAGYVLHGESLIGTTDAIPPGNGSLMWVEFQIIATPPTGGTLSSVVDINNTETFLQGPVGNQIPTANYDATYTYQSASSPPPPSSQAIVTISPSVLSFNTDTTFVGDEFNVTVSVMCNVSSFAWGVQMLFDHTQINVINTGLTDVVTSQFFAGHTTVTVPPVIDNTAGVLMETESLLSGDSRPAGVGSLFWVEFEIVAVPSPGGTLSSVLNINNAETLLIDPTLASIHTIGVNADYTFQSTSTTGIQGAFGFIPSVLSFDTSTTSVGDTFNVTVWTNCSVSTFAWEVKIYFNQLQINVVQAGYSDLSTSQFFSGHATSPVVPFIDNTNGVFMFGESLLDGDSKTTGGGTLFWVEFQIVASPPPGGTLSSLLNITNPDTFLLDPGLSEIPVTTFNAAYSYTSTVSAVHDVAVTNVTATPASVTAGQPVYVNVTAANEGTAFENFTVVCQYDSSVIGSDAVALAPGSNAILSFIWNTASVPTGVYTISANASVVPGETNTANNRFVDGKVTITQPPPPPRLTIFVKFTPQTLNWDSKGKWVTAQARLSGTMYSAGDVVLSTVRLNGTFPVSSHSKGTGNTVLTLKFDRAAIISYIQSVPGRFGYVTLVITGQMSDGTSFIGFGEIRIRMPGDCNCDGKVTMNDVSAVARAFGQKNYDTDGDGWISINDIAFWAKANSADISFISKQFGKTAGFGSFDMNEDGMINMKDIALVVRNFGKTY